MTLEQMNLLMLGFWLAVLGAVMGSFLCCAVFRWAEGKQWYTGRSRCDSCGHPLGVLELIPVFSWLFLRGKCRHCGRRIPPVCFFAELCGAAGFACLAGLGFDGGEFRIELLQWVVFAGVLLALSLTDVAKRLLPDKLLLLLAVNRVVWLLILGGEWLEILKGIFFSALIPGILLILVLILEEFFNREVMGGGDIKLLFVLALYLSWPRLLLALMISCVLGILGALLRKVKGPVPFGPFLAAGAILSVAFGSPLVDWYIGLF